MSADPVRLAVQEAAVPRRRGIWPDVARMLEPVRALAQGRPESDPLRVRWTVDMAEALMALGAVDRARDLSSGVLRASSSDGFEGLERALRVLGTLTWRGGDLRAGRALLERALDLARSRQQWDDAVRCCVELSQVALQEGRLDFAERYLARAVDAAHDDGLLEALPLPAIANTRQHRADPAGAASMYRMALELFRELGHVLGEGMALHGLANLALEKEEVDEAMASVRLAHKAYTQSGYVDGQAQTYNVLGEAHRKQGDPARAAQAYDRAIRAGDSVGRLGLLPRANLAVLQIEAGRLDEASALIEDVLRLALARGLRPIAASMHTLMLSCVSGDPEALRRHLERATDGLAETGVYHQDLALSARRAAEATDRPELAIRARALALGQWNRLGNASEAARERDALAELARNRAPIPVGPFDLFEPVGKGAMGEVWRARHRLGQTAAVKVVATESGHRKRLLALLEEEARAVVGLDHPNIVNLIDFGKLDVAAQAMSPDLQAGAPWLAMEMVPGGSLEDLCGAVPWHRAKALLLQVLDALAHAHSRGVLHLDIKPANVLLTREADPVAKLVDFGLAAVLSSLASKVKVVGTPLYMAPEQFRGMPEQWGPWTDLYALGCCAVHLVCGRPPYDGDGIREIQQAHLRQEPSIVLPEDVPQGFVDWARRLLSVEIADRYRFAADAAASLRAVDGSAGAGAPATPLDALDDPPVRARSGLALFELRRPPLVGRHALCRTLWGLFEQVQAGGGAQVVVLEGNAGSGKTALVQWLLECTHARGLAASWRVPADDPDPICALLEGRLGVAGLDRAAAHERIALHLQDGDPKDVIALASLAARERPEGFSVHLALPALVRLLQADLRDRTVLVHFADPVKRSAAVEALCRQLTAAGVGVLVLMEARPDDRPRGRGDDAFVGEGISHLEVGPLTGDAVRQLLVAMLPLHDTLTDALVSRAGGNPRLALQMLGSLVRRDAVVADRSGIGLRIGSKLEMPRDLMALWRQRVHSVVGDLGDDAWVALAVGALLGDEVGREAWRVGCEAAGVGGTSAVMRGMRRARLAIGTRDRGWRFAHPMLREVVIEEVRVLGRYPGCCAAVAQVPSVQSDPGRLGELLAAARELEASVLPLRDGAKKAISRGEMHRSMELLNLRADALHALGRPLNDPAWAEIHLDVARVALEQLDSRAAENRVDRALAIIERNDLKDLRPDALRLTAVIDRVAGRDDLAADGFREADVACAAAGDLLGQASCRHGLALIARAQGRFDEARSLLHEARELLADHPEHRLVTTVWLSIGGLELRQHRWDEAWEAFQWAVAGSAAPGRRDHRGAALTGLGEVARMRGDLVAAQAHYEDALRLRAGGLALKANSTRLNLALVKIARGHFLEAEGDLSVLLEQLEDGHEQSILLQWTHVALLPVLAQQDATKWDHCFSRVAHWMEEQVDPDIGWALRLAGERALDVDRVERARTCWALASSQYRRLGLTVEQAKVDALLQRSRTDQ